MKASAIGDYHAVTHIFVGQKGPYFTDGMRLVRYSKNGVGVVVHDLSRLQTTIIDWFAMSNKKRDFPYGLEEGKLAFDDVADVLYLGDSEWSLFSYDFKVDTLKFVGLGRDPQVIFDGKGSRVFFQDYRGVSYFESKNPETFERFFSNDDVAFFKIHNGMIMTVTVGYTNSQGSPSMRGFQLYSNGVLTDIDSEVVPNDVLLLGDK